MPRLTTFFLIILLLCSCGKSNLSPQVSSSPIEKKANPKPSNDEEKSVFKGTTTIVKFKPGTYSVTYKDTVSIGTTNNYIINAKAEQTITIDAKAIQETKNPITPEAVSYSLTSTIKDKPFSIDSGGYWKGKLPYTGEYILDISGGPGSTDYTIKIEIR